jgi:hypothetical protein
MTDHRFADLPPIGNAMMLLPASGFLVVPFAPPAAVAQVSPLQWLYQKMYEQAAQSRQPPTTRELFAIMN